MIFDFLKDKNNDKANYQHVSGEEAKKIFNENKDVIILDVRTKGEYDQKHINGSILIPDNEIENSAPSKLPNKDEIILVHCQSGMRSRGAAKKLIKMGYTNVYDFGAMSNW